MYVGSRLVLWMGMVSVVVVRGSGGSCTDRVVHTREFNSMQAFVDHLISAVEINSKPIEIVFS